MADVESWVLFLGVLVVAAILLVRFGSLRKAVGDVDDYVKKAAADELVSRQALFARMNAYEKAAMIPVENMGSIVKGMQENVTTFGSEIKDISVQLANIANETGKFGQMDSLMRQLHAIFVGTPSKGKAGEEILKKVMDVPIKMGLIKTDVPIGGDHVEYAIAFADGKLMPIDATVRSTNEIIALSDETLSPEQRTELAKAVKKTVKSKIEAVGKYVRPPITVEQAIVAVPDSIMEIASELTSDALERKVFLVWFSALPYLIAYLTHIYGLYAVKGDLPALQEKLFRVQHHLSTLNTHFFSSSFDKPLGKLQEGVSTMKETVSALSGTLALESSE